MEFFVFKECYCKCFSYVLDKPQWRSPTVGSVMAYGFIGGETNLTCDAVAEPEANYTWYRNGKEIRHQKLNVTEILVGDKSVLQVPHGSHYISNSLLLLDLFFYVETMNREED